MKHILVLNSGSTSLKFKIFNYQNLKEIHNGLIEKIGLSPQSHRKSGTGGIPSAGKNSIIKFDNTIINSKKSIKSHQEALKIVKEFLVEKTQINISLVIHRVVHGGTEFNKPVKLNSKIITKISKYNNLAPLHNPINLKVAKYSLELWKTKQIAVFDIMFFKNLPPIAYLYPLPLKYYKKWNIRKFGFHGFSHQGMLQGSAKILKKKEDKCNIITCHLGGGSSISAIKNGKAVEISMGFSPVSGLMMMTRSGDIDPAIIFHLKNQAKLSLPEIYELLNHNSGLKGITQINDLRDIMILAGYKITLPTGRQEDYKPNIKANKEKKALAKLALDLFIYRIQRHISSYITLLPKVDAIVFSGGIGERNSDIRNLIFKNIYLPQKYKKIIVKCDEEKVMAQIVSKS
ncbi:acetate kinase [bacterium]|nr:acetate kinase [bacterium]